MDAYKRGEIAQSATIVPADIAIITNIGDQHLERFGSKQTLAAALREIFAGAKPGARLLCTAETAAMVSDVWDSGRELVKISDDDILKEIGAEARKSFSSSNQINLAFAIKTAQLLQIPHDFITDACAKMELPDRRQKETEWHGYTCIDDSYNISLTTARAGIEAASALAKREGKKLLALTAGIPELGPGEKDGNEKLGALIAARADHAAILKSMFATEIANGIRSATPSGGDKKYTIFKDLDSFLMKAPMRFSPEQWVILVQPELTDLYY
jgi:UDP-N-acetylmuramoyl-tripeptide--D-alanyl-D-alanine ligase